MSLLRLSHHQLKTYCFFPSLSPTGKQVNAFSPTEEVLHLEKYCVQILKLLKICNGKRKIYSENQVCPARSQCVQSSIWGARTTTSCWTTFLQTIHAFIINCVSHNSKHCHSHKRNVLKGSVLSPKTIKFSFSISTEYQLQIST